MERTPVLLLTGYLGSGKTTLLNTILNNRRGIRFAVIVNDIGEVNIDADLIQKGGVVDTNDDSLVPLQNGCICCTLKTDLIKQINDILGQHRFDYIVIEASGICEPGPIAQTICSIPQVIQPSDLSGIPVLDSIVTVVDALRMRDEFANGDSLKRENIDEEDIENLVIQQIEFCNTILLNKASDVDPKDLERIRQIIRAIQPKADIIDCDYCNVDLDRLLNTHAFDFDRVATSATWISEVEKHIEEAPSDSPRGEHEHHHHDDEHEEHEHHHHHHDHSHSGEQEGGSHHHHHHHHDEDEGEAEEYGIGTFVYYRRKPFKLSLFDDFVARKWPKNIIRAKGLCYFGSEYDQCYLFEQAGKQFTLNNCGQWYATMPQYDLEDLMEQNPGLKQDWDPKYGDRMQKIVFIGQKLDKHAITEMLDSCLEEK